ncbi:MAG: ABC transporter permease, partial [Bryobacteraceae bacterium]
INTSTQINLTGSSLPNYRDYRDQNTVFTGLAAATNFGFGLTLSGQAEPQQLPGFLVSANYFDVLGVTAYRGRTFLPSEDKTDGGNPVAVMSYSLWTRQFGSDPGLVGRPMTLNGQAYTIVGIAPPNFKGLISIGSPDAIWIPMSMRDSVLTGIGRQLEDNRRFRWLVMIGRLKQGVTMRQSEVALKTIASALQKEYPRENDGRTVAVSSVSQAALGINQRSQFVLAGGVLMGVVGLVLLIACVNLANLLLARAATRDREMSIRAAMGAGRGRIVRKLLTESVMLALAGGLAGLLVAAWGRSLLWSYRPPFLGADAISLTLDTRVLLFTLGISAVTGLLFGAVPALKASSPNLMEVLKVGGRGWTAAAAHNRLRSLLVGSEIALALVALVGA